MAAFRLHNELPSSVQLTELVSETYLRLVDQSQVDWHSRDHFFAIAATTVRRVLVDRARRRQRQKRGDCAARTPLDLEQPTVPERDLDLLALDPALVELRRVQRTAEQVVELRCFGSQSVEETARRLGLGKATVVSKWRFAKAWLAMRLAPA